MAHRSRTLAILAALILVATPVSATTPAVHGGFAKPSLPTYHPPSVQGFTKPHLAPPSETDLAPKTGQGFTKPQQPQSGGSGFGFTKPGTTPGATVTGTPRLITPPRSVVDSTIAKGQSRTALAQFDADRQKFKAPPVGGFTTPGAARQSPVWQQYGTRWRSADDYYAARRAAERRLPPQAAIYYTAPPVWVSSGPPSYGAFSSHFLGGVLLGMAGSLAYDQWAYSHRTDPAYIEWHEDMERQAADNAELRDKLATLDAKVTELQEQNAPVTDKLPDDVDPSLVVAPETVMMATTKSGINWWLWVPLTLILLLLAFAGTSIMIARNRARGSYA